MEDIHPLRQPIAFPALTWWEWALLIVGLIVVFMVIVQRMRRKMHAIPKQYTAQWHELLLKALPAAHILVGKKAIRAFSFRLTQILKQYLVHTGIPSAHELTTQEVVEREDIPKAIRLMLTGLLPATDETKFAHTNMTESEAEELLQKVTRLIKSEAKEIQEEK